MEFIGRLLDCDCQSVGDIEDLFPGFQEAWLAVKDYMPAEFQPEVEEDELTFSVGEWDNILVYDASGTMIGRVDVWTHEHESYKFRDGIEYTEKDESISFNFNDADWNNIGRYETETDKLIEQDGELLETPIVTEESTFVSYSLFKNLDVPGGTAAWEAFQALYDLPETLTDTQLETLGFTWMTWIKSTWNEIRN